jgi:hypothetical protein
LPGPVLYPGPGEAVALPGDHPGVVGMKILVTGTVGFIGCALALELLARGDEVVGLGNFSEYHNVRLK